jgi:hypothetical protein
MSGYKGPSRALGFDSPARINLTAAPVDARVANALGHAWTRRTRPLRVALAAPPSAQRRRRVAPREESTAVARKGARCVTLQRLRGPRGRGRLGWGGLGSWLTPHRAVPPHPQGGRAPLARGERAGSPPLGFLLPGGREGSAKPGPGGASFPPTPLPPSFFPVHPPCFHTLPPAAPATCAPPPPPSRGPPVSTSPPFPPLPPAPSRIPPYFFFFLVHSPASRPPFWVWPARSPGEGGGSGFFFLFFPHFVPLVPLLYPPSQPPLHFVIPPPPPSAPPPFISPPLFK